MKNVSPKGTHTDIGIRTSNDAEAQVCRELERDGWEVLKRGWPDLLAVRNGEVRFIEVKSKAGAKLKPDQRRVAEVLGSLGVEVELAIRIHGTYLSERFTTSDVGYKLPDPTTSPWEVREE